MYLIRHTPHSDYGLSSFERQTFRCISCEKESNAAPIKKVISTFRHPTAGHFFWASATTFLQASVSLLFCLDRQAMIRPPPGMVPLQNLS